MCYRKAENRELIEVFFHVYAVRQKLWLLKSSKTEKQQAAEQDKSSTDTSTKPTSTDTGNSTKQTSTDTAR